MNNLIAQPISNVASRGIFEDIVVPIGYDLAYTWDFGSEFQGSVSWQMVQTTNGMVSASNGNVVDSAPGTFRSEAYNPNVIGMPFALEFWTTQWGSDLVDVSYSITVCRVSINLRKLDFYLSLALSMPLYNQHLVLIPSKTRFFGRSFCLGFWAIALSHSLKRYFYLMKRSVPSTGSVHITLCTTSVIAVLSCWNHMYRRLGFYDC